MTRPGLSICLILLGATMMALAGFTIGLWLLVVAIIVLPPKWDPAIQYKSKHESKSNGGQNT